MYYQRLQIVETSAKVSSAEMDITVDSREQEHRGNCVLEILHILGFSQEGLVVSSSLQSQHNFIKKELKERTFDVVKIVLPHPLDPLGQFTPPFAQHLDLSIGIGLDDVRIDLPQLGLLSGIKGCAPLGCQPIKFRNVKGIRKSTGVRGMSMTPDVDEKQDKRPRKKKRKKTDQEQQSPQ